MLKGNIKKNIDFDLLIIGAGASGMFAGITAASFFVEKKSEYRVAIIERHAVTGRKLLATGNGQCNLSNLNATAENASICYYGENSGLISSILRRFTPSDTIDFFNRAGVLCRTESGGKIYPYCNQASTVRDALETEFLELGGSIFREVEVYEIVRTEDGVLTVKCKPEGTYYTAKSIIIATGGKASPSLSSDGLGYKLCQSLGHSCTDLNPAIVRLKTEKLFDVSVEGVKVDSKLTLVKVNSADEHNPSERREVLATESGELLFTANGISGPPVLQLAGCIISDDDYTSSKEPAKGTDCKFYILANFFPDYSVRSLLDLILKRIEFLPKRNITKILNGMLPSKLAHAIAIKVFGRNTSREISSITSPETAKISSLITSFIIPIDGPDDWESAQITAGGVRLTELDCSTMESLIFPNVYITGELLDATGICGGYNLHFAWASGYVAGLESAKALM